MGKLLKIVGIILLIFIILLGIGAFRLYQYYCWWKGAEDMNGISLGSPSFNEKLATCSPAFGGLSGLVPEPWTIEGIKKEKCVVIDTRVPTGNLDVKEREGVYYKYEIEADYVTYNCELPYEVYSNPDEIDWNYIIKTDYCEQQ
ncbi:MAG: hypothetical protein HQ539_02820 [Parcubacteria group bacterium]|nr:hypothetical protein [Parcubacteria group bacterium]